MELEELLKDVLKDLGDSPEETTAEQKQVGQKNEGPVRAGANPASVAGTAAQPSQSPNAKVPAPAAVSTVKKPAPDTLDAAMERVLRQMLGQSVAEVESAPSEAATPHREPTLREKTETVLSDLLTYRPPAKTAEGAVDSEEEEFRGLLQLLLADVQSEAEGSDVEAQKESEAVSAQAATSASEPKSFSGNSSMKRVSTSRYPFRVVSPQSGVALSDLWIQRFYQLTEDSRVLGWIAFQGDVDIASDRDYDTQLLASLRAYQQVLEELRTQIGGMHIHKSFVYSEQGQIRFYPMEDGVTLAVFADLEEESADWLRESLSVSRMEAAVHSR